MLLGHLIAWMNGTYAFPGRASAEEKQSAEERTSNKRLAQLMDDMAVKEVSTQLEEAANRSSEVQQSLNEKTDSQLSPKLVFSGSQWVINLTQVDHPINLRIGRAMIAKPKLRCCR